MKILILSLGPVFEKKVHGGSQKILKDVAIHLGKKGHEVIILCNYRADNKKEFRLESNVIVKPILKFKEVFPSPYYTPIFNLQSTKKIISCHVEKCDVVYMHDAGMLFFDLFNNKPLIISPRDLLYPETLLGIMNFKRDKMIVSSNYMKKCLESIYQDSPDLLNRIKIIPNGVDTNLFHPKKTNLKEKLKIPKDAKTLFYPHRDKSKGIFFSLDLLSEINKEKNVFLVILTYMDKKLSFEIDETYKNVIKYAKQKKVYEKIKFVDWISFKEMPEYYSFCDVTLCIGEFPESFGNASIESILCGTLVILSKVAAQRTILPDNLINKITPFDLDEALNELKKIIYEGIDLKKIINFIKEHYNYKNMLDAYENTIISTKIKNSNIKINETNKFNVKLPAWCFASQKGIYNDYTKKFKYKNLSFMFLKTEVINLEDNLNKKSILRAIEEGYLVKTN